MAGRFTARRVASPELVPAADDPSPTLEGVSWTVFPEPTAEPVAQAANPLLTDKLLDAKVRLHRRLIEEINLSALEKLPEDEMRAHIQQLVGQYIVVERLALNAQELNDFVTEILDEMTGLGPLFASSTRSCQRSAGGWTSRIRCATRACMTARASTWPCGRSASMGRWCRSESSPRSRST
jgi:hypothetical protein